jgi:hypothetical protein
MENLATKTRLSVTIAFAVAVALCSCGKSESPATSTVTQQPASPPAAPPSAVPAASPAAASSATPAPVDGDLPGVKIAINELKRTSSTATLKFTVYNTSAKAFTTQGIFDGDEYHRFRHVGAIHLIDGESKKKYFVVTDSDGRFLCSNDIADIPPGSQITLWAKFPVPPSEVQKITVEIPHFVPFEDVAILQ